MVVILFFCFVVVYALVHYNLQLVITSGLELEVVMGRRRRLKKSDGGELEINRQDLAASDEAVFLPSVAASDTGGAQQHVSTSNAGSA